VLAYEGLTPPPRGGISLGSWASFVQASRVAHLPVHSVVSPVSVVHEYNLADGQHHDPQTAVCVRSSDCSLQVLDTRLGWLLPFGMEPWVQKWERELLFTFLGTECPPWMSSLHICTKLPHRLRPQA